VTQIKVNLLELRELNIISERYHSTVYFLQQISVPELEYIGVEVISDGTGYELDKIPSSRGEILLLFSVELVALSQLSDGTGVELCDTLIPVG